MIERDFPACRNCWRGANASTAQQRAVGADHLAVPGGGVFREALLGEVVESWLGFRVARRYGGSSRAGWGALVGGLVGAIVGVPVPLIGSVIGGFMGAFVGAALFEYTRARHYETAAKAGWGAVLGRAAAAAAKIGLGVVIAVSALFQALRG